MEDWALQRPNRGLPPRLAPDLRAAGALQQKQRRKKAKE